MSIKETMLTASEFAKRVGVSVSTITKQLRNGTLQGAKVAGKWQISERLINDGEGQKPPAPPKADKPVQHRNENAVQFMTAEEFCDLTYLTLQGVLRWLKAGRIQGEQDAEGNWRVDSASLRLPHMQHLIRKKSL